MNDKRKSRQQLLDELSQLRQRVADLESTEARYRQLFENAAVGIFHSLPEGRFLQVNPALARMLGYASPEEMVSTVTNITTQLYVDSTRRPQLLAATLNTAGWIYAENRYRRKDGSLMTANLSVRKELNPDGTVAYLEGFVEDITERKQIQEALARHSQTMAALYETSLEINSQPDVPTLLNAIVRRAAELLGVRQGGLYLMQPDGQALKLVVDHHLSGHYLGVTLRLGEGLAGQVAQTGQTMMVDDYQHWEHRAPVYDGADLRRVLGVPMKVGQRVVGVIDITDSQKVGPFSEEEVQLASLFADQAAIAVEKARLHEQVQQHAGQLAQRVAERTAELERERNQTRAILDSVGEGIYVMNLAGEIEYVNPALEQLTGYTLAEMRGHLGLMWRSGLTAQAVIDDLDRHVMTGEAWQGEVINRRQDGGLYTTATTIAPIKEGDQTVGIVGVQRDISHLKELDHLKDQFVTRIGHELRTPATNVRLYVDLLKHGRPDKYDQYLQVLTLESERLRLLVNGFLEIAEYDTSAPPRLTTVDLNQVAVELIADQHPVSVERGQSLDWQLAPGLAMGLADPVWIRAAVRKLMVNALDYTPRGGQVNVMTAVCKTPDQREWITLTVQDSGPGLSPEELPHIFERFYRGKVTNNYLTPGVGLGLSISQVIVEKLGGRITVESQTEQGAAFTIWIRAAE